MSGPNKPHDSYPQDHAPGVGPSLSHETTNTQPTFSLPIMAHHSREGFGLLSAQPSTYSYTPPHTDFSDHYSNYMYARSRGPEITSWQPISGSSRTKLYVYFRHTNDPSLLQRYSFSISFRDRSADATLMTMGHSSPYYQYVLSVDVPELDEHPHEPIPLCFSMQDDAGSNLAWLEFGSFVYTRDLQTPAGSSRDLTRKRKVSIDQSYAPHSSLAKRPSIQRLHGQSTEPSTLYALPSTQEESISPGGSYTTLSHGLSPPKTSNPLEGMKSPTDETKMNPSIEYSSTPRSVQNSQPRSSDTYSLPATLHRPYPVTVASRAKTKLPSPSSSGTPQLIRTSTIQPHPESPSTIGSQPFNPYTMYPHKAVLDIQGDLGAMVENWSAVEWENRRRLVQFERSQISNTIRTSFKPVTLDGRAPNSICISCIWWEEKGECFVTSVDTIYLLESLVAVRFTVEEKNRIRRNLEGFRPLTVSKSKSKEDSEEFFKVIMGFPNPKPRNIEKDVKVFPWKILAHALKKIISKYSASYSSTAGALLPNPSSGPSSALRSDSGIESAQTASPLSVPSPVPSMVATTAKTSTSLSPAMQTSAAPKTSAAAFAQHLTVPTSGTPQTGYRHYSAFPEPQYMALPSVGASWDFASYADGGSPVELMTNNPPPRYGPVVQYMQPGTAATSQPTHAPHYFDPYDPQQRHV